MRYYPAPDVERMAREIAERLGLDYLDFSRIGFVRSFGSRSKRTVARCHSLGRIWKAALGIEVAYAIEVIAERFDNLPEDEKVKTIIHELLHIPKSFGGGFRHHNFVSRKRVERLFRKFLASGRG